MHLKKDHYMIVYAVLAAAIVVSAIALIPIGLDALEPEKEVPTPEGSFGQVNVKSRYEIQVWMGPCTPLTNYSDCRLVLTTPDNERCTLDLVKDKYIYSMTGLLSKLTELRISDSTVPGTIGSGDMLTLYHNYPIETGVWNVELVYRESGKAIASRPVVSPDITSHPNGDFLTSSKVNEAKYKIVVGIVTPATDYAYCRLLIDPPGTTEGYLPRYLNLTEGLEQTMFYSDTIRVKLTAQNEYGLPQSGDTIEITSTGAALPFGQWTVALVYKFDGGRIAVKVFTLSPG